MSVFSKQPLCSTMIKNLSGYERLRLNIELNSNSGGQVLMIILLYYIYPISYICTSLLSGYNQCRDPINNGKDCRVGQLARSWWLINDEYSNSEADTVCLCLCSFLWVLRGWWTKADIIDTVNKYQWCWFGCSFLWMAAKKEFHCLKRRKEKMHKKEWLCWWWWTAFQLELRLMGRKIEGARRGGRVIVEV